MALALGASLHAVGQRASIAALLMVITLASIIGGAVPVPGGIGVVQELATEGSALTGYLLDEILDAQPTEVRDVLLSTSIFELGRERPGGPAALHRRAARWYERNGPLTEAVRHAVQAGDRPAAGPGRGSGR